MKARYALIFVLLTTVAVAIGAGVFFFGKVGAFDKRVRVLTYSSFINSWGPGPDLAKLFEEKTGTKVEFIDAGDTGLLLKKLSLFPADVVLGLDAYQLSEARKVKKWQTLPSLVMASGGPEFLAFDWAPMTFVYRKGEIEPPRSLDDLLDPRFRGKIALEDPRTSTPGLQFLYWILEVKGRDAGFEFLARLKPNIHSVSSSWSTAYGLFQKGQAALVFSYLTSPVYHWVVEKDASVQAVKFPEGLPSQYEYVAIPSDCRDCQAANDFLKFLFSPEAQKYLMEKNFMLPTVEGVEKGTPFAGLTDGVISKLPSHSALTFNQEEILAEWKKLGL